MRFSNQLNNKKRASEAHDEELYNLINENNQDSQHLNEGDSLLIASREGGEDWQHHMNLHL